MSPARRRPDGPALFGPDAARAALEEPSVSAPLAARMRPRTLEEFVGQGHLLGAGSVLRGLIEEDRLRSVLLFGPPGTGKTSLAMLIARSTQAQFSQLSAVTSGVADVRKVVQEGRERLAAAQRRTVLFIDEVHRFNKAQQDALLPGVEDGSIVFVGATTENPFHSVIGPLLSRSTLFRLDPLSEEDLGALLARAHADPERGLGGAPAADNGIFALLANLADGDARVALNALEAAADRARARGAVIEEAAIEEAAIEKAAIEKAAIEKAAIEKAAIEKAAIEEEDVRDAMRQRLLRWDRAGDRHYDVASAFIKALRGSDPDAALAWLVRMIEAGEDPRFVARRMVILASEDIGAADDAALQTAVAAAHAVELVGLPEAAFNLAHAAVALALAPKSDAVKRALGAARADLTDAGHGEVPAHLRDASYRGAARLGHGKGYQYPHDHPSGRVEQQYMPEGFEGRTYWKPEPRIRKPGPGPAERTNEADRTEEA